MELTAHCITTARNKERQEAFLDNWSDFDVQFHYAPDWRDIHCYGHARAFGLTCCLVGHLIAWDHLKDKPGWHLITEDDALPKENIHSAVKATLNHDRSRIVKFMHNSRRRGHGIMRLTENEWLSSACYMIKDTRLFLAKVYLASPDRLLRGISNPYGFFPRAAYTTGGSTIEQEWSKNAAN